MAGAKSALFDLISDVRVKMDSDEAIRREYDSLIKEMVLSSSGAMQHQKRSIVSDQSDDELDPQASLAQPLLDLIAIMKNCIQIIGRNLDYQKT